MSIFSVFRGNATTAPSSTVHPALYAPRLPYSAPCGYIRRDRRPHNRSFALLNTTTQCHALPTTPRHLFLPPTPPSIRVTCTKTPPARPRQLKELERKREQQQKATLRQLAEKQNEAAVLIDNFCAEFDKDGDG